MRHGLRFRHVLMGALGVLACALGGARAADAPPVTKNSKPYSFDTADGVHLAGNLWSNAGVADRKDATVILLHDFDPKGSGGSSRDDGWDDLAEQLLSKGYSVFSFDFRGFGESTKIDPDKFWDPRQNPQNQHLKNANKTPRPEVISHSDFEPAYYPYLVNDIIAAKAFLDDQNDSGSVNTSSVFVIGAGAGATLGTLWMDTEWHRQKGTLNPVTNTLAVDPTTGKAALQEPEGKDQAGAIWLSLSPKIGERSFSSAVHTWVGEVGGENRVPMGFLYGGKETAERKEFAVSGLTKIVSAYRAKNNGGITEEEIQEKKDEELKKSGQWKLPDTFKLKVGDDTTLSGNKLLADDATKNLIGTILNHVMGDRKNLASRKRNNDTAAVFWTFSGRPTLAKNPMSSAAMPLFGPQIASRFGVQ